jgi:NAD(P)-dependent dehydrogenase (short-subunit alcohol dehydrogenase family)
MLTIAPDVKNREQANEAVKAAVEPFGRLDVLVNNAGYGNIVTIEEATEEEFRDQIETDFWGVINVTRAALPVWRQQRSGHIIQISSIGGRIGSPGLGAYQAARWGIEGFSEVLAQEVKPLERTY